MSKARSYLFEGTSGAKAFISMVDDTLSVEFLKGSSIITNDVIESVRVGSALKNDSHHAFPDIVDNYVGMAHKFNLVGGDGKARRLYQLSGSLNGKQGIFEWIVEPGITKRVTHRRFIEGGTITGKPNQNPKARR